MEFEEVRAGHQRIDKGDEIKGLNRKVLLDGDLSHQTSLEDFVSFKQENAEA